MRALKGGVGLTKSLELLAAWPAELPSIVASVARRTCRGGAWLSLMKRARAQFQLSASARSGAMMGDGREVGTRRYVMCVVPKNRRAGRAVRVSSQRGRTGAKQTGSCRSCNTAGVRPAGRMGALRRVEMKLRQGRRPGTGRAGEN